MLTRSAPSAASYRMEGQTERAAPSAQQRAVAVNRTKSRAVIHYRLGGAQLAAAFVHRLLGFDVFYLHADGMVRRPDVRTRLASLGIRWFDFMDYTGVEPGARMRLSGELARRTMDAIPHEAFDAVLPLFRAECTSPARVTSAKLRTCMFHELTIRLFTTARVEEAAICLDKSYRKISGFYAFDATAVALARSGALTFGRAPLARLLGLTKASRIAMRIAQAVLYRFKRLIARPQVAPPVGQPLDPAGAVRPQVIYLPHQGVSYGSLFRKDYLYQSAPESPLHPANILHVEHEAPTAAAQKTYREAGISCRVMMPVSAAFADARALLRYIMRNDTLRSQAIASQGAFVLPLMTVFRQYRSFQRALRFAPGSVAVVGYDQLLPRVLALALQGAGVTVIASQERLQAAYFGDFSVILDHYMVAGEKVAQYLGKHEYCSVDQFHPIGLTRCELLQRFSATPRHRPQVLVLDYSSPLAWWGDTDPIVNRSANRGFYRDIIRLATERPDIDFVIRGKSIVWLNDPYFADEIQAFDRLPNVTVDRDYSEFDRSYRLAVESNALIAKYTSLGDECLAMGKAVIFHDWASNSESYAAQIYDYEGLPVFAHRYESLRAMLDAALAGTDGRQDDRYKRTTASIFHVPAGAQTTRALAQQIIIDSLGHAARPDRAGE